MANNTFRSQLSSAGNGYVTVQNGRIVIANNLLLDDLQPGPTPAFGIGLGSHTQGPVQVTDNSIVGIPANYLIQANTIVRDMTGMLVAQLPNMAANGSQVYVTDGVFNSNPLTAGGIGTIARRIAGTWIG